MKSDETNIASLTKT